VLADARELGGDMGRRNAEDIGDLLLRVAVEGEQEHCAVEFPERLDERVQAFQFRVGWVLGVGQFEQQAIGQGRVQGGAAAALAVGRDRDIQGDPVDPGGQLVLRVIAPEGQPQLQADLLDEVLAVLCVLAIGPCDLVDDPLVGIEQVEEGGSTRSGKFHV